MLMSGHVAVFISSCVSLVDHNSYVPQINYAYEWPCGCFPRGSCVSLSGNVAMCLSNCASEWPYACFCK